MCGRYSLTSPDDAMRQLFAYESPPLNIAARYNTAPTQQAPVVRQDETGARELVKLRWGLVPSWADDFGIGARMINARSETVAGKPAFRAAFQRRRCLVPATGWYEWKSASEGKDGKISPKQPYAIGYPETPPFAFAGLWESWDKGAVETTGGGEGTGPVETYTILTRAADEDIAKVHHRMPVILDAAAWDTWLAPDTLTEKTADLLLNGPTPEGLIHWPVSTRVNKPANDDPSCLEPADPAGADAAEAPSSPDQLRLL